MSAKKKLTVFVIISMAIIPNLSFSQKSDTGISKINSEDLEAYVSFLASPSMKGRSDGEPELEITVNYLASQAKLLGLKPANGTSYLQPYTIIQKSIDAEKSMIKVFSSVKDSVILKEPMIQLFPVGASDFEIEGEVAFAGYGIKADKYSYNDLENITTEGKILLLMNRSPLSDDGTKFKFEEQIWSSFMSIQAKLTNLLFSKAKAILIVPDPKSGFSSIEKEYPGIANELKSSKYLKGSKPLMLDMPGMPRIIFVQRAVADEVDKKSPIDIDYSLSGRDNPLQLYSRSDHYNFAKKDIPILFFSTGLHTDYHKPGDVAEKLDYEKMELIAKMVYEIGYTISNRKTRLVVDNPFSKW